MYVALYLEFLLQKLHLYTDVHNVILYCSMNLFVWHSLFALNIKPSKKYIYDFKLLITLCVYHINESICMRNNCSSRTTGCWLELLFL